MLINAGKYASIYLLTMLKFVAGPTMGPAMGLSVIETVLVTVLATMTVVFLFTSFGKPMRRLVFKVMPKRKKFTKRNRRIIKVWQQYGLAGVSFLTPILLTPIGGSMIISFFGAPRQKVFSYMLVSSFFWAVVLTYIMQYALSWF